MTTFLLTWNPMRWEWSNLAEVASQTEDGRPYSMSWSTGNTKRIVRGDRVFLLKQGEEPRGIIASGYVTSEGVYDHPHYNPERAAVGETAYRVDVEWERIINPSSQLPLAVEDISSGPISEFYWHIPASGIELPEQAALELEVLWEDYLHGPKGESEEREVTNSKRNPPWQRDELILALELYFRHHPSGISQDHEEVINLSKLLNCLPIHTNRPDPDHFRNPNGIYMKLCNFLRFDPSYTSKGRKGLKRGNRLEEVVWKEFHDRRDELIRIAGLIRNGCQLDELQQPDDGDECSFPEGRLVYRIHRSRERNRQLVYRAKLREKQQHGTLSCMACGFNFKDVYGPLGEDFIECHHTQPLSEMGEVAATRLDDIALVCSNCHRMIHLKRPWLSMDNLRTILINKRQGEAQPDMPSVQA